MLALLNAEKKPATIPQYTERSIENTPAETTWGSDLAASFKWLLQRFLHSDAGIQEQVGVRAFGRRWTIDFVIECSNLRIGICIDEDTFQGEEDLSRDVVLADLGVVDVLYRLNARDLRLRMVDCLFVVLSWHPALIEATRADELENRVSDGLKGFSPETSESVYHINYTFQPELDSVAGEYFSWPNEKPASMVVRRLSGLEPASWMPLIDQAYATMGIPHEMRAWGWSLSA